MTIFSRNGKLCQFFIPTFQLKNRERNLALPVELTYPQQTRPTIGNDQAFFHANQQLQICSVFPLNTLEQWRLFLAPTEDKELCKGQTNRTSVNKCKPYLKTETGTHVIYQRTTKLLGTYLSFTNVHAIWTIFSSLFLSPRKHFAYFKRKVYGCSTCKSNLIV